MSGLRFYNQAISAVSGMSASTGGGGGGGAAADFEWTHSTAETKTYYFTVASGKDYVIDWGDGNQSTVTGTGGNQGTAHTYGIDSATGKITPGAVEDFLGVDISFVHFIGDLPDPSQYTSMVKYKIQYCSNLTGLIPSFNSNVALTDIYINNNNLNDTLDSMSALTSLEKFYCTSNGNITGAVPDLSALSALTTFGGNYCNFSSYNGTSFGGALKFLYLKGSSITSQAEIDKILDALDSAGASSGTVDLSSGTNAVPSAAGLTSKSNLEARGWTVTVNS